MQILTTVLCTASFVVLCFAAFKINLDKIYRVRQILMPAVAIVYAIMAFLVVPFVRLFVDSEVLKWIEYLIRMQWDSYSLVIINLFFVLVYIIIKTIVIRFFNRYFTARNDLVELLAGRFYDYDEEYGIWFLRDEFDQAREYLKVMFYVAIGALSGLFILTQSNSSASFYRIGFYPVFIILILGEIVCFLDGVTKFEFFGDVSGEDDDSVRVGNYSLLRDVLKNLFPEHVLFDYGSDTGLEIPATFEILEEMKEDEDPLLSTLGTYFSRLKESGVNLEAGYVKSCVDLMQGRSVLFCNPFYRDLTDYIMIPIAGQLMRRRKCLVIAGRDSSVEDMKDWLKEGLEKQNNVESLWRVEILSDKQVDADVGIIRPCDILNLEIQKENREFLDKVRFVFIAEPSAIMATGQMGLSILNECLSDKEQIVYAACDRNCDGLVDALSHTLRVSLSEVWATTTGAMSKSVMCWNADGEYMHHKLFPNVSRYLGIGTELNAVAMRFQISHTNWIGGNHFPVNDMKWIAGQYYRKICDYVNLPSSQEMFNKSFTVDANLWDLGINKNAYLVVEDEFRNAFEAARLFGTRATQQSFVNVVSENYLLRDYMMDNANTFLADAKAVPAITADFTRSERNTIFKLLMRMAVEPVSEDDIADEFLLGGINSGDTYETFVGLIEKHCSVDNIKIAVAFREQSLEDGFRTVSTKYYSIEPNTDLSDFVENLKNAYYIAEDEEGDKYYIGSKLYGHVYQEMLPGEFITFDGRYYEVRNVIANHGVVLRRAADHINDRRTYRQIRDFYIGEWKKDKTIGSQKSLGGILISRAYCNISVETEGYLELSEYNNLKDARKVEVSNVPVRDYRNKLVMRIDLPDASEEIAYTLTLLLNEVFRTVYPETCGYICALTDYNASANEYEQTRYAMYSVETDESCRYMGITAGSETQIEYRSIYIVEDSDIDLGLIESTERNLERYLQILAELLCWYEEKGEAVYLKYGYDEISAVINIDQAGEYLNTLGYDKNPLKQVRDNAQLAADFAEEYDPKKPGAHFCDFCGVELVGGEYDILKDGRERCSRCSATSLRKGEDFEEIYTTVLRNMELFFGIKINVPIHVRMTDAKTIARATGSKFVATPGFDPRVLGFARKDSSGYTIYVENGAPRLSAMSTIAHELTHIWQYCNWNEKEIEKKYGKKNRLIIYEGMASWVEIQYILYLNETIYGKRQEIVTLLRDDEYGQGFKQYLEAYPLSYDQEKKNTPFRNYPPL